MKVHAYLLCFNEEDIIQHSIDHYAEFCSRIFIMDNMSTDNSVAIAKKNPKVSIISWDSNSEMSEKLQAKMKSTTYRSYSREGGLHTGEVADWVISCDMDELLYHPDILDVLTQYKNQGITVPRVTGINMISDEDIKPGIPLVKQYTHGVRSRKMDKRIVFHPDFDMTYGGGAHPSGLGFEYMKQQPDYFASHEFPLTLLHFKRIGSRFLSAAKKNLQRLPEGQLTTNSNGQLTGDGKHYHVIVNSQGTKKSGDGKQKAVFNEDGSVDFSTFRVCDHDGGITPVVRLSPNVQQLLNELAVELAEQDPERALQLALFSKKVAPTHSAFHRKARRLINKLGKPST